MNLFEAGLEERLRARGPLASRLRPTSLNDVVGQDHLLGPRGALRALVDARKLTSVILWGPAGTGKTTIARLLAAAVGAEFESMSAVTAGVKDVRVAAEAAKRRLGEQNSSTLLLLDEVHRFTKSQQDALLPSVEDGTLTLVGATTENPFFEINGPLLSRSTLFRLEPLDRQALRTLLDRGLKAEDATIDEPAAEVIIDSVDGDGRALLTTLEVAVAIAGERHHVALGDVERARTTRALTWGRDDHYDVISAFIKTIRGSDPDAAVYWLARMIESGEDALFIARRLVILASEDVGLADRHALPLAIAAQQAVHFVGMPEGFYPLAHAVLYLATAPKSNTVGRAYKAALADVERSRNDPIPLHLRNAPTKLMKNLGYGEGYRYAHTDYADMDATGDLPPAVALQSNLPERLGDRAYFDPAKQGDEARLRTWIDERRRSATSANSDLFGDDE
ncbi:MAG: replication-associated recombination protein A [Actinomycetota bacterium]|nr:replication-associated recombination protein A [Actinomycetota bacterium]